MRRLQIVFAIVLLGAALGVAHGQSFSIKGGLSFGVASNTGLAPGAAQRSGFAVGVGIGGSGPIALGIEGLYAQRGFNANDPDDARHLDYIDVPIYLKLSLSTPGISPFAYVGPQGSYELKCGTDGVDCADTDRAKLTYAGVIGGGARFGMLGGLTAEARYVYGLSDLNLTTVGSPASYKTRSLLLLVGIGF